MEGIASMPPVYYPHLVPAQVKKRFSDCFEEGNEEGVERDIHETGGRNAVVVQKLADMFVEHGTGHTLKVVPETDPHHPGRCVQKQHLDKIAQVLNGPMTTERIFHDSLDNKDNNRRSLADLGLKHGVANSGSFPDAYFHTKRLPGLPQDDHVEFVTTSIVECKDTTASPGTGVGEAIAMASAAAVAMARLGMPTKDVVVPVLSSTGDSLQVAAVYMLEPSLPTVCFVTHILALSKPEDRVKAARIIAAMASHADKVEDFFSKSMQTNCLTPRPEIAMEYDETIYQVKLMKDFFSCSGENLHESSFLRLLHRTRNLADMSSVCLPIAVRLRDGIIYKEDAILFRKLVNCKIGLPTNSEDRVALVTAIESVVREMHKRGVVHMDLYLSNSCGRKKTMGLSVSVLLILTQFTNWARF